MKIYYARYSERYHSNTVVVIAETPADAAELAGENFTELAMEEIGTANPDQESQVVLRDYWNA
jgi:hypothetical protein